MVATTQSRDSLSAESACHGAAMLRRTAPSCAPSRSDHDGRVGLVRQRATWSKLEHGHTSRNAMRPRIYEHTRILATANIRTHPYTCDHEHTRNFPRVAHARPPTPLRFRSIKFEPIDRPELAGLQNHDNAEARAVVHSLKLKRISSLE